MMSATLEALPNSPWSINDEGIACTTHVSGLLPPPSWPCGFGVLWWVACANAVTLSMNNLSARTASPARRLRLSMTFPPVVDTPAVHNAEIDAERQALSRGQPPGRDWSVFTGSNGGAQV